MASKKGKKAKGQTMSFADFSMKVEGDQGVAQPGVGQNVVYTDKSKQQKPMLSNWADEMEDDPPSFIPDRVILPSGTRASRGPAYNDEDLPKTSPFTAHLGNLPYELGEADIYHFFRDLQVIELKLPRDQAGQKLKGFGYAEFATRDDLREALEMNESLLRGRKVRVSLGTGQQDRRGDNWDRDGMGMRGDGERRSRRPPAEDEDVIDWRSQMKPQEFTEPEFRRGPPSNAGDYGSMPRERGGYNNRDYNRDRGYGDRGPQRRGPPPQEELDFSRSQMMQGPPPPGPPHHQGGGGGNYNSYGGGRGGGRGGFQDRRDRGDYYDNRDHRGGDRDGRGDPQQRYGNGGYQQRDSREQNFYRGRGDGPPSGPPSGSYAPQTHSRHHSSDASDAEAGAGTWRRQPREHTLSQSSQSSQSQNYGNNNAPSSGSAYQPPHRGGDRDRGDRERDRDYHHQRSHSPPMLRRSISPGDRDNDDHEEYSSRSRDRDEMNHRGGGGSGDDEHRHHADADLPPPKAEPPKERKRLVLQPRTVEQAVGAPESGSSSIFGGAKPVDTQKREREIEEKLEQLKVDTTENSKEDGEGGNNANAERGNRDDRDRGAREDRRGDRDDRRGDRDRDGRVDFRRGDRDRGDRGDRGNRGDRGDRMNRDRVDRGDRDHRDYRDNRDRGDREMFRGRHHSGGKDHDEGSERGGRRYHDDRGGGSKGGSAGEDDEWTTIHRQPRKIRTERYEIKKNQNGGTGRK